MTLVKLALLLGCSLSAADEDVVIYATGKDGQGRATIRGTIRDVAAGQLAIQATGGREQRIEVERVLRIDTVWNEPHTRADRLAEQGDHEQAATEYVQAFQQEQRPWVQRRILASMIRCLSVLRRYDAAGEGFLALVRTDPQTHFFDAIPLAWTPQATSVEFQQKAKLWLDNSQAPVAALLGASWLLTVTTHQAAATTKLRELANHPDSRIAYLAATQLWRLEMVTANEQETQRWQATIERMDSRLRFGPYFILGQALARQGRSEEAATAMMRVPILYPEQRDLASQALLSAAAELEKLGRTKQAQRLYQEIAQDYPNTQAAAEAQGHLNRVERSP